MEHIVWPRWYRGPIEGGEDASGAGAAGAGAGGAAGGGGAAGTGGTAGAGTGAAGTGTAAGGADAAAGAGAGAGTAAGDGGADPQLTPAQQAAFAKRLEQERAKLRTQIEGELGQKYGTHAKAIGALAKASGMTEEQVAAYLERKAQEAAAASTGMSPEVHQELEALKAERQQFQRERRESALGGQEAAVKADPILGPHFDEFGAAAKAYALDKGVTLEEAMYATGGGKLSARIAEAAAQRALAAATGRDGKTPVNTGSGQQVTPELDIRNLPKDQFEKVLAEVKAGKRKSWP